MARVLIVGCGCRGRALAAELVAGGYQVRGTTRSDAAHEAIRATGAEPATSDPLRLATIMPAVDGVSAVCWLLGSARGGAESVEPLHGSRLESMLELLVDTHVRGFVYEAAGSVGRPLLERGAAIVARAGATHGMPAVPVAADPSPPQAWTAAMAAAVDQVLGATG